jgi:hypothetical protein
MHTNLELSKPRVVSDPHHGTGLAADRIRVEVQGAGSSSSSTTNGQW